MAAHWDRPKPACCTCCVGSNQSRERESRVPGSRVQSSMQSCKPYLLLLALFMINLQRGAYCCASLLFCGIRLNQGRCAGCAVSSCGQALWYRNSSHTHTLHDHVIDISRLWLGSYRERSSDGWLRELMRGLEMYNDGAILCAQIYDIGSSLRYNAIAPIEHKQAQEKMTSRR